MQKMEAFQLSRLGTPNTPCDLEWISRFSARPKKEVDQAAMANLLLLYETLDRGAGDQSWSWSYLAIPIRVVKTVSFP